MKVLVLFDGSENSFRALNFVKRLARSMSDLEATVLHVIELWETGAWGFLTLPDEIQNELVAKTRKQIEPGLARAKEILTESGAKAETVVLVGEPVSTIIEYADKMEPDMVVLGSRGHGPVRELVLGGICHKILQLAKQTVVLVR
ncbi:MAG: universal stress protein [Desulfotomaculales bacterium]